jgi:hypothetical protein
MIDDARGYLGQQWIGTNQYDKGECVGLFNKVVLDVTGILYPLQGAQGAKDLMTCKNTRPDLFQQVWNDPNDPNQLPSVNDWIIWGSTWGGGYGHVACVENVNQSGFTSIAQNETPHTVTRNNHNWNGVIGWIHYTPSTPTPTPTPEGGNMTDDTARQIGFNYLGRNGYDGRPNALAAPQPDLQGQPLTNQKLGELFLSQESRNWRDSALPKVYADRDSYKAQVNTLDNQVKTLNNQIEQLTAANQDLQTQLDAANKRIAELEAAGGGTSIVINFNFFGQLLWKLIKKTGMRSK